MRRPAWQVAASVSPPDRSGLLALRPVGEGVVARIDRRLLARLGAVDDAVAFLVADDQLLRRWRRARQLQRSAHLARRRLRLVALAHLRRLLLDIAPLAVEPAMLLVRDRIAAADRAGWTQAAARLAQQATRSARHHRRRQALARILLLLLQRHPIRPRRVRRRQVVVGLVLDHRLADVPALGVARQVDMEMVVVHRIGAGAEHGREMLAGTNEDLAQEGLFLGRAAPAILHGDDAVVVQPEGKDVDGIAEGMLGGAARAGAVVHGAAGIGAGADLDHLRAEHIHRCRLHHLGEPFVGGGNHRAGQGRIAGQRDAAIGEGRDLERLLHAAGAGAIDRLAAQADIGGELHLARGQALGFSLVTPGRALRLLELAAAGKAGADDAEREESEMNATHDRSNARRWVNGLLTGCVLEATARLTLPMALSGG
ncbi:hypothetical protein BOS5A_230291 [Bosea sp. EC-HK365B]|nr:hypothetical protein BOSE21B_90368 [Bosea sp. 21B]CAD5298051.1 hypothetical protein BOSE7B_60299 [Bosea sp. 7B]VVT61014.1 hypothetical protein BOS5A_230291 [Bosea sp. EC-HK365B]VXB32496.1 hypothetical protein BOSE127_110297 [Bosea sp. 127]